MVSSTQLRRVALTAIVFAVALAAAPAPASASDRAAIDIAGVVRASAIASSGVTTKAVRLKRLERKVLRQLNAYRGRHGRRALRMQHQLRRAALVHARSMAKRGFFAHESANGEAFDTRVKRYYTVRGFRSWSVGENLLWASGKLNAKRAISLWNNSPGHRRNMRDALWRQIGVAAVRVRREPGVFKGLDVTIVVTDFGTRS